MGFVATQLYVTAKSLLRDKTDLFFVILFPLLLTSIFIYIFGGTGNPGVKLGVVNLDGNTSIVTELLRGLEKTPVVSKLVFYDNISMLKKALLSPPPPPVDAGLVIPRGFSENLSKGLQARLTILVAYRGTVWSNYTAYTIVSTISKLEDALRLFRLRLIRRFAEKYAPFEYVVALAFPLNTTVVVLKPERLLTPGVVRGWYVVAVMLVEALFIGIFSAATWLVSEAKRGTLKYMLSLPAKSGQYIAAILARSLFYTAVASLVALATGYMLGARLYLGAASAAAAALLVALATLFSASIGALIACFATKPEGANAAANAIGFTLMFTAGIIYPPWLLPGPLKVFAEIFPLSRLADATRAIMVYGVDPLHALMEYTPPRILAATLFFIAVAIALYRRRLQAILETGKL